MRYASLMLVLLVGAVAITAGCSSDSGPSCDDEAARATCLSATQSEQYYIEQGHLYFNTMDYNEDRDVVPPYSPLVARWEWPPWLKLTAFGYDNILAADTLLRLYPSVVPERDCRAFSVQPFARCRVTFYYDDHGGLGCPIYEEFTFNDAGEITFIEAWSDQLGMLPMAESDPWAQAEEVARLSSRIPGLGNAQGLLDLDSEAMSQAAAADADIADFVTRANHWFETWSEELDAAGDEIWTLGCGW